MSESQGVEVGVLVIYLCERGGGQGGETLYCTDT